jgi:uncharacterized membrane-anchored protein
MAAWRDMKLATLRRRTDALPGVSGVARLDRRTPRLAARLNRGDIAVIDHVDLDRITAEVLIKAKPAAIVNVQPCISGRYPNLGPEMIVAQGIVLLDSVGSDVFGAVKEGTKIRIDGDTVYQGEDALATGTPQDIDSVAALMLEAEAGLAAQLEAFAQNTSEFLTHEREMLLDGVGIPEIRTQMARKHALVVVRGPNHAKELKSLKHYIREYKPVLVGVEGGADALVEAGLTPHLIIGEMEAVSDTALTCGAEVVVRAERDGRAPGLPRVQDLGIDAVTFPTSSTSEDAAMLLVQDRGAQLVVSVGSHATLNEFVDQGRDGMASSFLTRLRLGATLVDAKSVTQLYRNRISAAALLLLVLAAFVAIVAALSVSDTGRTYLTSIGDGWHHLVNWVEDSFS